MKLILALAFLWATWMSIAFGIAFSTHISEGWAMAIATAVVGLPTAFVYWLVNRKGQPPPSGGHKALGRPDVRN